MFLLYAMRRVACPQCGVKVETVRLGKRQASTHRHLCLVPGTLGETTVVEGSGRSFPYELGEGVSLGGDGGRMGACVRRRTGRAASRGGRGPARRRTDRPVPGRRAARSGQSPRLCRHARCCARLPGTVSRGTSRLGRQRSGSAVAAPVEHRRALRPSRAAQGQRRAGRRGDRGQDSRHRRWRRGAGGHSEG